MSSFLNNLSSMSEAFKTQWDSVGWKSQPMGKQIYQRPHPLTTEEKCRLLFLRAEGTEHPHSFVDKRPPIKGFHGTSMEALGGQLQTGKFDNQNKRIYVAPLGTAGAYAQGREQLGQKGVIVEVSSPNPTELNDFINKNLGFYFFIPPGKDQEVYIERVWEVRNDPRKSNSLELTQSDPANISQTKRLWLSVRAALDAVSPAEQAPKKA